MPYDLHELLSQISIGNESAFRQLFDSYHHKIYSFSFYLTHSATLAKDITQDIFIKVWMNREQLSSVEHFEAWLKTVVRNHTYNYLHRLATERLVLKKIEQQKSGTASQAENEWLTREYDRLLAQAIAQLSEQQQKVFLLSRREGMKHEAIACVLGLSVNTVKNHMKAALQSIRRFFEDHTDAIVSIAAVTLFFS